MHETEWGLYRHLMPDDSKESKHEFYLKYSGIIVAQQMAGSILPYTIVNNPQFTLHDINHSFRVCENMNMILDRMKNRFSSYEVYLLYQAGLLHDIGMVFIPRMQEKCLGTTHGAIGSAFLTMISESDHYSGLSSLGTVSHVEALGKIIESHCMPIEQFEEIEETSIIDENVVHLKQLCAILCIADGLDMGSMRISSDAYHILTDENIMKTLGDIVGKENIPSIPIESRFFWEMESGTNVELHENTIIIEVRSNKYLEERIIRSKELKRYLEILDLNLKVWVISSGEDV